MTLSEFRHWLDGFTEAIGEAPTPEQWARIQSRLAEVREAGPAFVPIPTDPFQPLVMPCVGPASTPSPRWPEWSTTCGGSLQGGYSGATLTLAN